MVALSACSFADEAFCDLVLARQVHGFGWKGTEEGGTALINSELGWLLYKGEIGLEEMEMEVEDAS